ncbi:hypothetical protein LTR56_016073 [Elasticomyces elasticus]|nr:hypothetical protein LTR56_016073 [Elasticomyces elasticus]KAK3653805.1 hypothetical protein LTR22_011020 [Elasticomyces elasticus]KAK4916007.1 hypothetical protein LTR49_015918 [Elasticomyces elasticus]
MGSGDLPSLTHTTTIKPAPIKPNYSGLKGLTPGLFPWRDSTQGSFRTVTQSPRPDWHYGDGATEGAVDPSITPHVEIDPFAEGRPMSSNYALMVSAIVPRPIGLVSTLSRDGKPNLAPFSYFQVVDHNPPMFVVGFAGRAGASKDTLTNLEATGECTINLVSEHMVEAANACSIDAPFGVSEWDICGLKQAASAVVRPARVQESVFSIEGKLVKIVDYDRKSVGSPGRLGIIEGVRFWVREDAIDAQRKNVDLDVLRPVGQLGGISYSRTTETFELPRTNWATASETKELKESLGQKQ